METNLTASTVKPRYAKQSQVTRTIEAARAAGVAISAVEVGMDGSIRIVTDRLGPDGLLSEFDRLDALGQL